MSTTMIYLDALADVINNGHYGFAAEVIHNDEFDRDVLAIGSGVIVHPDGRITLTKRATARHHAAIDLIGDLIARGAGLHPTPESTTEYRIVPAATVPSPAVVAALKRLALLRKWLAAERVHLHAEDRNSVKLEGQQQLILQAFANNVEYHLDTYEPAFTALDAYLAALSAGETGGDQ